MKEEVRRVTGYGHNGEVQEIEIHIPTEEICQKIIKGVVLDVFVIITNNQPVNKSEIQRCFAEYKDGTDQGKKYRHIVDIAIAKLEGTLFVDTFKEGGSDKYFATDYGKAASSIITRMINEDPDGTMRGADITRQVLRSIEQESLSEE
ncbi:MAG: hypothetical protein ACQEXV_22255 [Bacillota bacterium]